MIVLYRPSDRRCLLGVKGLAIATVTRWKRGIVSELEVTCCKYHPEKEDCNTTKGSDFMGPYGTGTYSIPLRSWRQAQQPPENRTGIRQTVME